LEIQQTQLAKQTNQCLAFARLQCKRNCHLACASVRIYRKLNIDGYYNQICQCGSIKTEVQMLITYVSKILVEENIFSHSEFTTLNRTELIKILLFGHPELSKNLSLCLF